MQKIMISTTVGNDNLLLQDGKVIYSSTKNVAPATPLTDGSVIGDPILHSSFVLVTDFMDFVLETAQEAVEDGAELVQYQIYDYGSVMKSAHPRLAQLLSEVEKYNQGRELRKDLWNDLTELLKGMPDENFHDTDYLYAPESFRGEIPLFDQIEQGKEYVFDAPEQEENRLWVSKYHIRKA